VFKFSSFLCALCGQSALGQIPPFPQRTRKGWGTQQLAKEFDRKGRKGRKGRTGILKFSSSALSALSKQHSAISTQPKNLTAKGRKGRKGRTGILKFFSSALSASSAVNLAAVSNQLHLKSTLFRKKRGKDEAPSGKRTRPGEKICILKRAFDNLTNRLIN
jgi:hypothetical protein